VGNLIPLFWEENFHFMAKVYTHKVYHQNPKAGLQAANSSKKSRPSASCGEEAEGLRRRELSI
jgi:hypothetical protein